MGKLLFVVLLRSDVCSISLRFFPPFMLMLVFLLFLFVLFSPGLLS